MLSEVKTQPRSLQEYKGLMSNGLFNEINTLGAGLKGLKVYMVNATPAGGGVAEMLISLIPLLQSVGINGKWFTIPPRADFFEVTKGIHNSLQSKPWDFPFAAREIYLAHTKETAALMRDMKPDVWIIHDPQPAGVVLYLDLSPAALRIHIDLTAPNPAVWKFISGFGAGYEKIIVSSPAFVRPEISSKAVIFTPAIDVFSAKNRPVDLAEAKKIVKKVGIDPNRPLMAQVSRFDPWKDPLGVISAYKIAKKKIPSLQLVIAGFMEAQDDPEGAVIYETVRKAAVKEKDVFLLSDPSVLGGMKISVFTNAIQAAADVVVQNSTKEGFGLVVTEAMWKGKPVVGGLAEGLKTQIEDGENGFLVATPEAMAKRICQLAENKALQERMGKKARKTVQDQFLMPRLVRDYMRLFNSLLGADKRQPVAIGQQQKVQEVPAAI